MQSIKRIETSVGAAMGCLVLAAAIGITYLDAPDNGFHLDDFQNIVDREAIHVTELSLEALASAVDGALLRTRPVANVTFAIDWYRGDGQPATFIHTNIAIHTLAAIAALVLYYILFQALSPESPRRHLEIAALLAALCWALHPIHVQSVSYIVQRMNSLAALFMIATVICYLLWRTAVGRRTRWLAFCAGLTAALAACFSKENAYLLPLLLVAAELGVCRTNRRHVLILPLDLVVVGLPSVLMLYVAADLWLFSGPIHDWLAEGYARRDFSLVERLLTQPRVILFYGSLLLWPDPRRFSLEHDFELSTGLLTPPTTLVGILLLILWGAAGIFCIVRARYRIVGFLLLWVVVTLAVESSLVPLELVFEHRTYTPSVGIFGLLGAGLLQAMAASRWSAAPVVAMALLLALFTAERIPHWRSEVRLNAEAVRVAPRSARAWNNYAIALYTAERQDEALAAARTALAIGGRTPHAFVILAYDALDRGDVGRAEELMQQRLQLGKVDDKTLNTRGAILLSSGRFGEAARLFEDLTKRHPQKAEYWRNLAIATEQLSSCEAAREQWRTYLSLERDAAIRARVRAYLENDFVASAPGCRQPGDISE